jgi:hypothetical protein
MRIYKKEKKMKKLAILILLSISINVFANQNDIKTQEYKPKINHGTLIEKELSDLPQILGLSIEKIAKTPVYTGEEYCYREHTLYESLLKLQPQGFYEQKLDLPNQKIYRVEYKVQYTFSDDDDTDFFCYERIYSKKTGATKATVVFESFISYPEYGWQDDLPVVYGGSMLIIRNQSFDGVMIYRIRYQTLYEGLEDEVGESTNTHEAFVYFFDSSNYINGYSKKADIEIKASLPLSDKNDRFKYTIQNAFDQNPGTSYVEDTDDDFFEISLFFSKKTTDKFVKNNKKIAGIRLINGYAANEKLYYANNRIKSMVSNLFKNTLSYQYIKAKDFGLESFAPDAFGFSADSIYKGSKYNDTCLAELDWELTNNTWLFGGRDE